MKETTKDAMGKLRIVGVNGTATATWIVLVGLSVAAMGCANRRSERTLSGQQPSACGDLQMRTTAPSFATAFDIGYVVMFEDDYCIPSSNYSAIVVQAFAVELRPAWSEVLRIEKLERPLRFERAPRSEEGLNPLGGPQLLVAAVGGPDVFEVPPGRYRLILRYRVGRCDNKVYDEACTASSDEFTIEKAMRFTQERVTKN